MHHESISEEERKESTFLRTLVSSMGQGLIPYLSKHMNDTNEINIEIIEECVAGKGKHPVTSHLEDRHQSLCDTQLSTLAEENEAIKN